MRKLPITDVSKRCDLHNAVIPFIKMIDQNDKIWEICPYCLSEFLLGVEIAQCMEYKEKLKYLFAREYKEAKEVFDYINIKIGDLEQ